MISVRSGSACSLASSALAQMTDASDQSPHREQLSPRQPKSVAVPGSVQAGPSQSWTGHHGDAAQQRAPRWADGRELALFHLRIIVHQEIRKSSKIGPNEQTFHLHSTALAFPRRPPCAPLVSWLPHPHISHSGRSLMDGPLHIRQ